MNSVASSDVSFFDHIEYLARLLAIDEYIPEPVSHVNCKPEAVNPSKDTPYLKSCCFADNCAVGPVEGQSGVIKELDDAVHQASVNARAVEADLNTTCFFGHGLISIWEQ